MKVSLLILLILSLVSTHAQADFLDDLIQMAEGVLSPRGGCDGEEIEYDHVLLNKCAIDMCGPPSKNPTGIISEATYNHLADDDFKMKMDKFEKLLRGHYQSYADENAEIANEFLKHWKDNNLTGNQGDFNDSFYEHKARAVFNQYIIDFEVDTSKPFGKRVSYKLKNSSKLPEKFKEALKAYAKKYFERMYANETSLIDNNIYSEQELKKKFIARSSEAIKKYDQSSKKDKESDKLKDDLSNVIKDIDTVDYDVLKYALKKTVELEEATGNKVKDKEYKPICDELCKQGLLAFYESVNLDDIAKKFQDKAYMQEQIDRQVAKCKSQALVAKMSEDKYEQALKVRDKTVSNFRRSFIRRFSSHTQRLINEVLTNQTEFDHKHEREGLKGMAEMDKSIMKMQMFPIYKGASKPRVFNELLSRVYVDKNGTQANYFVRDDVCKDILETSIQDKIEVGAIEDNELVGKHKISTSIYSNLYHEPGKGLIAHELGHLLSLVFNIYQASPDSKKKFDEMRACASSLYKKPPPKHDHNINLFHHDHDHLRTEEDMADLVSFIMNKGDGRPFSCSLLEPDGVYDEYQNLNIENYYGHDVHSSPILRILMESIYKNIALPDSCEDVVEKYEDHFRFEKCI